VRERRMGWFILLDEVQGNSPIKQKSSISTEPNEDEAFI
jgi:hypothetical protein